MGSITFRELQRMTVKAIQAQMPLEVTSNGDKVFRLISFDCQAQTKPVSVTSSICKHNAMKGLCKQGCL